MIPMSSRCTFTAFHVHASSTHTRCVLATSPSEPWITPLFYVLLPGSCWVRASRIKRSPSPQFVLILLTLIDLLLDTLAPVEYWMSAITHFQSYFSIPGNRSRLTSFHLKSSSRDELGTWMIMLSYIYLAISRRMVLIFCKEDEVHFLHQEAIAVFILVSILGVLKMMRISIAVMTILKLGSIDVN